MTSTTFNAISLALLAALTTSQSHASTVTAHGPTGDLSVNTVDNLIANSQSPDPTRVQTSYSSNRLFSIDNYATAQTSGDGILIQFQNLPWAQDGGPFRAQDVSTVTAGSSLEWKNTASLNIPLVLSPGATQTTYQVDIDITLHGDIGSYGWSALTNTFNNAWFAFSANFVGTHASGTQETLLNFTTGINDNANRTLTLSAILPAGTDINDLTLNLGTQLNEINPLLPKQYQTLAFDGSIAVNDVFIHPLSAVLEPGTASLLTIGLVGVLATARRRKQHQ